MVGFRADVHCRKVDWPLSVPGTGILLLCSPIARKLIGAYIAVGPIGSLIQNQIIHS